MKKIVLFLLFITTLIFALFRIDSKESVASEMDVKLWKFQSIDTMKFSRDLSREKVNDATFDTVIDQQVRQISQSGATHVAIATPYDSEFLPFLTRWVKAARKYHLKVWFRGNFSGWEGWFGYEKIDRNTHKKLTQEFILENADLFENGDVFSSCPECENGGPGDPRFTRDVTAYRQFLIDEYDISKNAFDKIKKNVVPNYHSMNGDVAKLIMDKETTKQVGGVVVVDHYVKTPTQLAEDIKMYAKLSGGKVILGEFGAPIPDIHGDMSEEEQSVWLKESLIKLAGIEELLGVNYWVGVGGSTGLWMASGEERIAASDLHTFFKPEIISGVLKNELGEYIKDASIKSPIREFKSNKQGEFSVLSVEKTQKIVISAPGYLEKEVKIVGNPRLSLVLVKENENLLFKLKKSIRYVLDLP